MCDFLLLRKALIKERKSPNKETGYVTKHHMAGFGKLTISFYNTVLKHFDTSLLSDIPSPFLLPKHSIIFLFH